MEGIRYFQHGFLYCIPILVIYACMVYTILYTRFVTDSVFCGADAEILSVGAIADAYQQGAPAAYRTPGLLYLGDTSCRRTQICIFWYETAVIDQPTLALDKSNSYYMKN